MKYLLKFISLILVAGFGAFLFTIPVLAVPTLPSSFYGTVKLNNSIVPDGTKVQALIGGKVFAEAVTQTYQGDSVYSIDVTGDDTDTAAVDGGREGDTIQFKIGGLLAGQTGVWHTGTDVSLNLTAASTSTPIATPQATLTPVPTQTAIPTRRPTQIPPTSAPASATPVVLAQVSPIPTATNQLSINPTPTAPLLQAATQPASVLPTATVLLENPTAPVTPASKPLNDPGSTTTIIVVSILGVLLVVMVGYEFINFQKTKK